MKHLVFLVFMAMLHPVVSIAQIPLQESTLDSLLNGKDFEEQYNIIEAELHIHLGSDGPRSILLSKRLIETGVETGNKLLIGHAHYLLAVSYEISGKFDLALEECYLALDNLEDANQNLAIGRVYNEMGIIYLRLNNSAQFPKGLDAFNKYISLLDPEKNKLDMARAYTNMCGLYMYLNNNDSALESVQKSIALYDELKLPQNQIDNFINIGLIYYLPGTKDSSAYYWRKAEELALKGGNLSRLSNIYQNLIDFYIDSDEMDTALNYISKKKDVAHQMESSYDIMLALQAESYYYENLEDYKKALSLHKEFKELTDSIMGESTSDKIANLDAAYDLKLKDKQIVILQEQQRVKKLRIQVLIGFSMAIFSIAFLIIFIIERKKKQDKRVAKLEYEKQKLREEELQVQIEYKSKQMTSHALNMMMKNQFISELEEKLSVIQANCAESSKVELRKLAVDIQRQGQIENDWELFRSYFEEVNTGFYDKLTTKFPGLSSGDYKLCALLKLNLNIKESASILNISPDSVKTARYRLRKKLGVDQNNDLHEFIQNV